MRLLLLIVFFSSTYAFQLDTQHLPNPFNQFGNQPMFSLNSMGWVKEVAESAYSKRKFQTALHAWFYLYRNNHPTAHDKIEQLLVKMNKPLLRYLFLAHTNHLHKITLDQNSINELKLLFEYLILREKLHKGFVIPYNEFIQNKYSLSEYYYHQNRFDDQLIFLNYGHEDPFGVLSYHKLRTSAVRNKHVLIQNISDKIDDFFRPQLESLQALNGLLEKTNEEPIIMDPEHIEFLSISKSVEVSSKQLIDYPYLIFALLSRDYFEWNTPRWASFIKLLKNPYWHSKFQQTIDQNNVLKQQIGTIVAYFANKTFSPIPNTHLEKTIKNGFEFQFNNNWPKPFINTFMTAAANIPKRRRQVLKIEWADIKMPFLFNVFQNQLIVSYESLTWSLDIWKSVLERNYLYFSILRHFLSNSSRSIPPLWLVDCLVNYKSSWSPSLHGMDITQTKHLAMYPLTLNSMFNAIRNMNRRSLFFVYHWQTTQIGSLMFRDKTVNELLQSFKRINSNFNSTTELIALLSELYGIKQSELMAQFDQ